MSILDKRVNNSIIVNHNYYLRDIQWFTTVCRRGYKVVRTSGYAVVMTSFFIAFSDLKMGICSCIVGMKLLIFLLLGYAVAWWLVNSVLCIWWNQCNCIVFVQLHILSWNCDNLVPTRSYNSITISYSHYLSE